MNREVTARKKDVWEEANAEFYTESYPSGSKTPTTHHRRPSRLAIPLPSHTARRGSLLQGSRHFGKSGHRRKPSVTALTYTSTMAATENANGTTTNANDIQVAILPDLSEGTILNEKKTWEELHRIKSMPVPMTQKRQLKAQLTNLPKLRLKGWSHLKYLVKKSWKNVRSRVIRSYKHTVFLHDSLQAIELRSGTAIVNVFLFIKWTLFLNLAISIGLIIFIIGPYLTNYFISDQTPSPANATTCETVDAYGSANNSKPDSPEWQRLIECCEALYVEELQSPNATRGGLSTIFKNLGWGDIERWPISFSFYHETTLYDNNHTPYHFDAMYVITGCFIFLSCLLLMVHSIARGVKEVIQLNEGEFYKYSNLVFAGWEHYTNDEPGAEFKRRVLRKEMRIALQTEAKKINDLMITKRQKLKIYLVRLFVNFTVVVLVIISGVFIFYAVEGTLKQESKLDLADDPTGLWKLAIGFIPSFVISIFNISYPLILSKLGKLEQYSRQWETSLVLIRALAIRIYSIYAAAYGFARNSYCIPLKGFCTKCDPQHANGLIEIPSSGHRKLCWESIFGLQIYRLMIADLLIKIVITFVTDPLRKLLKHCCKNKVTEKIGHLSFNIVRHSLDVIYIQTLSMMSFFVAPFSPLFAVIYCFLVFYIKKFSVLYNCTSPPDTFRTSRTTITFMAAKMISFIIVLFTFVSYIGFMVPSRECGPFRGLDSPWQAMQMHLEVYPKLYDFLNRAGSPGVAVPISLILILLAYYYYSVAIANRAMVETLRHLLILEGHDKQYLFGKLNSLRRKAKPEVRRRSVFRSVRTKELKPHSRKSTAYKEYYKTIIDEDRNANANMQQGANL
ncbi:Transmembrane channel-like protein 7 [Orchesella cincta]|uniref:Transmembrane channel-like protein 7 n=1 Tax=Orchesella cincta TaxID=48709 RepID=A0A1D2NK83_ORCCI|nr:Transmembrane channel-like protein 7 [Orchesella cincta]